MVATNKCTQLTITCTVKLKCVFVPRGESIEAFGIGHRSSSAEAIVVACLFTLNM